MKHLYHKKVALKDPTPLSILNFFTIVTENGAQPRICTYTYRQGVNYNSEQTTYSKLYYYSPITQFIQLNYEGRC